MGVGSDGSERECPDTLKKVKNPGIVSPNASIPEILVRLVSAESQR